jgi:hypothetical protein
MLTRKIGFHPSEFVWDIISKGEKRKWCTSLREKEDMYPTKLLTNNSDKVQLET